MMIAQNDGYNREIAKQSGNENSRIGDSEESGNGVGVGEFPIRTTCLNRASRVVHLRVR